VDLEDLDALLDDADRELVLGRLEVLIAVCEAAITRRYARGQFPPRTESQRHLRDTGHLLSFGCCIGHRCIVDEAA
jgi:hypothetical protein